jgi:hypothetical protein
VNAAVAGPAAAWASVSVRPELFLCLLHRLAAVVTTVEEFPADGASLPEPDGTWLPSTAGLVDVVAGEEVGGEEVGGELDFGVGEVEVGEGEAGGVSPGSTAVLLLAQLAELDGAGELAALPGEEACCDFFTAVLPLPWPPVCEPAGYCPELVLVGKIDDEASSPT